VTADAASVGSDCLRAFHALTAEARAAAAAAISDVDRPRASAAFAAMMEHIDPKAGSTEYQAFYDRVYRRKAARAVALPDGDKDALFIAVGLHEKTAAGRAAAASHSSDDEAVT
jgi:hypothetical protein